MRICFYTNIVSPHQLPFARELVKRVGAENYRYIYSEPFHAERSAMGWKAEQEPWILSEIEQREEAHRWLEDADILILGHRDLGLIERRCQKGLLTFYASERWFKPVPIKVKVRGEGEQWTVHLPGWVRLVVPGYFRMAWRFVSLFYRYDSFRLLPYGVWATRDFHLLCRLFHPLTPHPSPLTSHPSKITTWGYAVAPATDEKVKVRGEGERRMGQSSVLRVLWVGRMIPWKRADTIIRAVMLANERGEGRRAKGEQRRITLTLVGDGPEKSRLQHLATTLEKELTTAVHLHLSPSPSSPLITFLPSCPISEIRSLMCQHDVYVLSSNGEEGWGAALNEAMEEGLLGLGTKEAGASATLLPRTHQYSAGNSRRLVRLLQQVVQGWLKPVPFAAWGAAALAERFLSLCEGMRDQ